MKKTIVIIILLALASLNCQAYELIKIKLLEITVPAEMDDHGKFGLATPDFELLFRVRCGNSLFGSKRAVAYFDLPENRSKKPVTHKIDGIELHLNPKDVEYCQNYGPAHLAIEENELFGTDDYLVMNLDQIFYSKDSPLKVNSSVIKTLTWGDGEADWTIMGFGKYKSFSAKVEFKSVLIN